MSVIAGVACDVARGDQTPQRWPDQFATIVDRHRGLCFTLLAAAYLLAFNGQWLMGPDSALYLSVGRNIALGRGYTYLGLPHQLVYPGLPYALAALFRIFGTHAIAAADAMILLCAWGTIALTYRLMYLAFDRPTAVVITLGFALTHEYFRYCYEILTDIPFVMGVMALLAGHEAIFHRAADGSRRVKWWDWALLLGGLAVAVSMRPTMIGLVGVWIVALFWSAIRGQGCGGVMLASVLGATVVLMFMWLDPRGAFEHTAPRSYEQAAFSALTGNLSHRLHNEVVDNAKDLFGMSATRSGFGILLGPWWMNAIFGTAFLACGIALVQIRPLWGMWVAATVAMLLLLVSHDRYMVEILPLLVAGWWRFLRYLNRRLPRRMGNLAFAALMILGTVPNAGEVGGMIIDQRWRPFLAHYKEGRLQPYVKIARELKRETTPADVTLAPKRQAQILTFLSDRKVAATTQNYRALSAERLFVVMDSADDEFVKELAGSGVVTEGPAISTIARDEGQPPLELFRGRQQ
jgi:hypothetical protein